MKKRFTHFIPRQSKKTLASIGGGLLGAIVLVVGALIFSTFSPHTQLASATLSPQSIGLGQGVAACFSSLDSVTCDTAGRTIVKMSVSNTVPGTNHADAYYGAAINIYLGHNYTTDNVLVGTPFTFNGDGYHLTGGTAATSMSIGAPGDGTWTLPPFYATGGASYTAIDYSTGSGVIIDEMIFTAPSCVAPVAPPIPAGTISATGCTISSGNSSCAVPITWTAVNSQSTQLNVYSGDGSSGCPWNNPGGGASCGAPTFSAWVSGTSYFPAGASGGSATLNFPSGTYTPIPFGTDSTGAWQKLDTKTVTAACVSGTVWDGTVCAPTTFICSPVCTVGQTCTATNTCSCNNGLNTSTYPSCSCPSGQTQSGSSCVATSPTCSPVCTVGQTCTGTNTCSCNNGLNISTYPSCSCPSGQTQSGSSCVATSPTCSPACAGGQSCVGTNVCACPTGQSLVSGVCSPSAGVTSITILAAPTRVRKGDPAVLQYSAKNVTSCTISGPAGVSLPTVAPTGGNIATTTVSSTQATLGGASKPTLITAQSTFTLTCATGGSPASLSSQAVVNVIPTLIER